MSEEVKDEVVLEGKMAEFADWVETISVLELSQLVSALEDRLVLPQRLPLQLQWRLQVALLVMMVLVQQSKVSLRLF